jgi:hypothetical protein
VTIPITKGYPKKTSVNLPNPRHPRPIKNKSATIRSICVISVPLKKIRPIRVISVPTLE